MRRSILGGMEPGDRERAWMDEALRLADRNGRLGNVPVGAVVLDGEGRCLARAANLRDTLQEPTAHAELLALRDAARALGSWRLTGATLVVTLEPCAMCTGALLQARLGRLVYAAEEPKTGAVRSVHALLDGSGVAVRAGVAAEESAERIRGFFRDLREARRGRGQPAAPGSLRRDGRADEGA